MPPTKVGIYDAWNNQRKRIADRPTTVAIKCFRCTSSTKNHNNNTSLLLVADVKVMHEDYHMICSKARSGHSGSYKHNILAVKLQLVAAVAPPDAAAALTGNSICCCRLSTAADRIRVALHLMTTLKMSLHAAHYLNVTANECVLLRPGTYNYCCCCTLQTHRQSDSLAHGHCVYAVYAHAN